MASNPFKIIMEMDRLPHANVLEQRTGNRKFIWSGLRGDRSADSFTRSRQWVYQALHGKQKLNSNLLVMQCACVNIS